MEEQDEHDRDEEKRSRRESTRESSSVFSGSDRDSLPPGSDTAGDEDDIPATVREADPYDDAPGQGKFAPEAPNPPPEH